MAKLILSFSELAGMYFPGCSTPKNAVRNSLVRLEILKKAEV